MKRFVIGDIHGTYKALKQCIEKSGIDKENDLLICLGDVADSYPEVPECFNELLEFKNLVYIMGNHDYWMLTEAGSTYKPPIWLNQGGQATVDAYNGRNAELLDHLAFLRSVPYCHITEDNILFVHGGYPYHRTDIFKDNHELMWNRDLLSDAMAGYDKEMLKLNQFNEVYIGHTATQAIYKHWTISSEFELDPDKPINVHNLWNMDTGAGWSGRLSMMDIDSKEIFQSDNVLSLYPNARGR